MQQIKSGELKNGCLLKYEETFNESKATLKKTKVISLTLLFVFLSKFSSLFVFLLMTQDLCYKVFMLEKMMLLMWVFPP
jgi:hypothetical protein